MKLDHDVHLVAHGISDFAKRLQCRIQVLRADVLAVRLFCGHIKRPDLHAGDAFGQQRLGHLVGAVQKALQVFIRPCPLPQAPVRTALVDVAADVLVTRASVVHTDLVAALASEGRVHRHASGFAKNIPQRDVHRRVATRFHAGATPAQITGDVTLAGFDGQRVLAHQFGRDPFVQISLDRLRAHEGFAQAHQALVGVQTYPDDVGKLAQSDGFELRDFHGGTLFSR